MDFEKSLISIYPEISKSGVVDQYSVHWGDMDAAKHVNNLIYLKWCESGRISFFRAIGIDITFSEGIGPILGWMDAKYIRPITYPDQILVTTSYVESKSDRLILESRVYSQKLGRLAFISKQEIIPYNYQTLKKAKIPNQWLARIARIQDATEQ